VKRVLKLDEALLLLIHRLHAPRLTRVMRMFTRLGDGATWTFVSLVLIAVGGASIRYGLRIGIAALIATLLVQVLKRFFKRKRPSHGISGFTALADNPDAFSFPSGHTAAAFAVAISVAGLSPWLGPFHLGIACAIGLSRVYLGAHYPLDVGVGIAVGSLAGAATRMLIMA
jgi:undecaprenyl-diphosphatase